MSSNNIIIYIFYSAIRDGETADRRVEPPTTRPQAYQPHRCAERAFPAHRIRKNPSSLAYTHFPRPDTDALADTPSGNRTKGSVHPVVPCFVTQMAFLDGSGRLSCRLAVQSRQSGLSIPGKQPPRIRQRRH